MYHVRVWRLRTARTADGGVYRGGLLEEKVGYKNELLTKAFENISLVLLYFRLKCLANYWDCEGSKYF